jgi:predicted TIM-barrel fold metal-dependent hydrolase
MLDDAVSVLGPRRLLWACDLTMETGLAKLRALEVIGLSGDDLADIRWRNAARLFASGSFPSITERSAQQSRHASRSALGAR